MIYKIVPALKDYLWAGSKLKEKYNKGGDFDKISESWELSINESGLSKLLVDNKEVYLKDYLKVSSLGQNYLTSEFKMLIKLIDSDDNLSIQVHPSDEYALKKYSKLGKTEMWYIIEAEEGAFIYLGFNDDYTREEVSEALKKGEIIPLLNKIEVKPGDFFSIPSGTVHAIGKGITLYEIQENSDLTFRLYDYERKDKDGNKRELHIDEALNVLSYKKTDPHVSGLDKSGRALTANGYFELLKVKINKSFNVKNNINSFAMATIIEGHPYINSMKTNLGDSYYIDPDTEIKITGQSTVLIARFPDLSLGLDVGGTSVKGVIIDDIGQKIAETKVPTESEGGFDKILSNMKQAYLNLVSKIGVDDGFFKKIGVGFPGNVDSSKGVVLFSNNLNLWKANISEGLHNIIKPDVIVDNDANCAALGEYYYTDKKKYHDMSLLTLGTGLGSGFIINSQLFKGGLGSATEMGHMKVKSDHVRCTCGQYGCLESLISLSRIKEEVDKLRSDSSTGLADLISEEDSPLKIFQLDETNEAAKDFVKKYQNNLLLGLVNLANILQPQVIVLGGGISYSIAKYIPSLEYRMNKFKFGGLDAPKIRLVQAQLGNDAGAYGAAALTKNQ